MSINNHAKPVSTAAALAFLSRKRMDADRRIFATGACCGMVFGFIVGVVLGWLL